MAKMSKENAIWLLLQMSRSSFYGPNVIEALRMGIEALRKSINPKECHFNGE